MTAISFEQHLPRTFLAELGRHPGADAFTARLPAAVLMTDISGFSALTLALTRQGAHGLETLQQILDAYFGSLGDVVERHGGDICTFAGDAVVAVWPAQPDARAAAGLAVQCALRIQQEARQWWHGRDLATAITQRIAVGMGELLVSKLGGAQGKWLHVFAGAPVVDAGRACDIAPPGQVLVTAAVARLLHGRARLEPAAEGCHRVDGLDPEPPAPAPVRPEGPAIDPATLAAYVPDVLVRRSLAGQDDWLAEFRSVTVTIVKLENIDFDAADSHRRLQLMTSTVQQAVQRYGGALPYVQMDDKGLNFIVAHGIPTAAHEDDAARALTTALEIQRRLREAGMRPCIGVATGILYCGECGARHRRQYSMIGPAINFAARLAGSAPDDLLSDEETTKAAGHRLSFTIAQNVRPKHGDASLPAFRPELRQSVPTHERSGELVGRSEELQQLVAALEAARGGTGARLLVSGEPGIGKSHLLRELRARAEALGITVITGDAQSLERSTPHFLWRDMLRQLLAHLGTPGEPAAETVLRLLQEAPQLLPWAPLLNDILPLALPETDVTREMRGAARASSIQALLLELARAGCRAGPLLLMVNDLHWIDAVSGEALLNVAARERGLSMVAASRPLPEYRNAAAEALCALPDLRTTGLGALDEPLTAAMVGRLCGVASVPEELSRLIHARAEGNPFHIQQLTLELRESGHIEVVGGRCQLKGDVAAQVAAALPATLRGIIASRVDRLDEEQQLLIKVASVFGRIFSLAGLQAIHPGAQQGGRIVDLLAGLVGSNLIARAADAGEGIFMFAHAIVQEAIYELLPMAQRKRQHKRIADWLEQQPGGPQTGASGLLANHCMLAEEFSRALVHLEGGAKTAIRLSAYREAIAHVQTAQRIAAERQLQADALRQASWHRLLGDSHHELSEYGQAEKHYLTVLELLGQALPPGPGAEAAGIALQVARLLVRRAATATVASTEAAAGGRHSLAAHAYSQLAEITYHKNKPFTLLHLTLLSFNEAARAQSIPELSAAHGSLAIACGQMGLAGPARRNALRATALAEARPSDVNAVAYAHLLAMVYATSQCDWPVLDDSGHKAEDLYAALGDGFRLASAQVLLAYGGSQRGDFAAADRVLDRMEPYLRSGAPTRVVGWALGTRLQMAVARGRVQLADVEEYERVGAQVESPVDRLMCHGTAALAWLRLDQFDRARASARAGLELLQGQTPVAGAGYVWGPLGVVEALLACWDRVEPVARAAHEASAALACAKLRTYTQQVPSTRPRGFFLLACHAERTGAPGRALKLWRRAAQAGESLGLPYDRAAALLALGQRLPAGHEDSARALQIFATLGVPPPVLSYPPATS